MVKEMVSLGVNPELITPIIEKEIKAAVISCMGGAEKVLDQIVTSLLNQKVDKDNGRPTNSSYNSCSYLEYHFTQRIEEAIKQEIGTQIQEASGAIKDCIIRSLRTKAGSEKIANAMLTAFLNTMEHTWSSKISISFEDKD